MLSKLAVRRLTKLADFMDALPPSARKHFDMSGWLQHEGKDHHQFGSFIEPEYPLTCGTTACAAGWAATIPSFRKAGFKMLVGKNNYGNWPLIHSFFDINADDSEELFAYNATNEMNKTPGQWAKHCRKFIKANT